MVKNGNLITSVFSGCCLTATEETCSSGQYCGFKSDRDITPTCLDCPVGYFKSFGEVCTNSYYGLNNDGFPSNVLSVQVNHFCEKCPSGYYTDEVGSTACQPCPGGSYGTSSTECLVCPNGTYSSPGSQVCRECPAGRFSLENASSCTRCPPDTYSVAMSSVCEPCM